MATVPTTDTADQLSKWPKNIGGMSLYRERHTHLISDPLTFGRQALCITVEQIQIAECKKLCSVIEQVRLARSLGTAVRENNAWAVRMCLSSGANPDAYIDPTRRARALHIAAAACDTSIVKVLIDAGANVDAQDRWGRTPLMEAVESLFLPGSNMLGMPENVLHLLDRRANPQLRDRNGHMAWDLMPGGLGAIIQHGFWVLKLRWRLRKRSG